MKLSEQVKSITYLKTHTVEVMEKLAKDREPFIITQNGEAKAVLMDIHSYDEYTETLGLLKRLLISLQEVKEGQYDDLDNVINRIKSRKSND